MIRKVVNFSVLKWNYHMLLIVLRNVKEILRANKYLDISFQKFVDLVKYQDIMIEDTDFLEISQEFINIIKEDFPLTNVKNALQDFWYDYNNRKKYVESPINYILKRRVMMV